MSIISLRESDGMVVYGESTIVDLFKKHNMFPVRRIFCSVKRNCGCLATVLAMEKLGESDKVLDRLRKLGGGCEKSSYISLILGIKIQEVLTLSMGWDGTGSSEYIEKESYKLANMASKQVTEYYENMKTNNNT